MKILHGISNVGAAVLLAGGALTGCATLPQRTATDATTVARRLVAAHQNAIVTIMGTLKVTTTVKGLGANQQNEAPVKAVGTLVDDSGLVVTGRLLLDPVGSMIRGPMHIQHGEQTIEVEMKSQLVGLHILMADKTEVPARVVLQDDDLGLLVLAAEPKAGAKAPMFAALPLAGEAEATLFAPCLVLGRTGELFQKVPFVGRGMAVNRLAKPRPCWVFMSQTTPLGLPVFTADGRWLGLGAMDIRPPDLEHLESMEKIRPLPIVWPAVEIRDLVERAKLALAKPGMTAKPPAKNEPARVAENRPLKVSVTGMPLEQARALIAAKQDAVVVLRGSVKFTDGHSPQTREEEIECMATVVDGAGFALCGSAGKNADRKYLEQRLNYVLRDGTEVPARIVLQDDDLALIVLAPAPKPGAQRPVLSALALEPHVKAALFDDVLLLSRLDHSHHYAIAADTGKIMARVSQPRTFYLTDGNPGSDSPLGAPVLLADGRLLGLLALVQKPSRSRRSSGLFPSELSAQQEGLRVVPAAALAELLEQAHKVAAKLPAPAPKK